MFFEDRRPPPPEPEPDEVPTVSPAPERQVSRRRAPRFVYRAVVDVSIGRDVRSGAVRDLSEVGAFVAMPTPFPRDAIVTFGLPLPTGRIPVVARVVWSRGAADRADCEPGLGVDFLELGDGGRDKLTRVLAALARVGARALGAASDPSEFELLDPDDD